MRSVPGYAAAGLLLTALAMGLAWPFLGMDGRRGVVVAAAAALPMQVLFYALLARARAAGTGFLGAWVTGMLGRLALVGAVALVVVRREDLPPAPTLTALAGLLFGLLLLEPAFLPRAGSVHGRRGP